MDGIAAHFLRLITDLGDEVYDLDPARVAEAWRALCNSIAEEVASDETDTSVLDRLRLQRLGAQAECYRECAFRRAMGRWFGDAVRTGGAGYLVFGDVHLPVNDPAVDDVCLGPPPAAPCGANLTARRRVELRGFLAQCANPDFSAMECGRTFRLTRASWSALRAAARTSVGVRGGDASIITSPVVATGPVYVMYDAQGRSQEAFGPCVTLVCAVLPGPSPSPITEAGNGDGFGDTLLHALRRFDNLGVEYPVLPIEDARTVDTVVALVAAHDFSAFRVVFLCPVVGAYAGVVTSTLPRPRVAVVVVRPEWTVLAVADVLARRYSARTGVLCPLSKVDGGRYWEGGWMSSSPECGEGDDETNGVHQPHSTEEIVALETTALATLSRTHHPELYTDTTRSDGVHLD